MKDNHHSNSNCRDHILRDPILRRWYEEFYEKWYSQLTGFFWNPLNGIEQDIDDLVQETLLAFLISLAKERVDIRFAEKYLWGIARKKLNSCLRRRYKCQEVLLSDDSENLLSCFELGRQHS